MSRITFDTEFAVCAYRQKMASQLWRLCMAQNRPVLRIGGWIQALTTVLRGVSLSENARGMRAQLASVFRVATPEHSNAFAVLAFGSVARLDPARDLDLLVLDMHEDAPFHEYVRVTLGFFSVDLNVVNETWFRSASRDLEWGNWLSESYPLVVRGVQLELLWRSASAFWSPSNQARRRKIHQYIFDALLRGSAAAKKGNRSLLSRLLTHEAARSFVCASLDCHGSARMFSHRTLWSEYSKSQVEIPEDILVAMKWDRDEDRFIELRHLVSEVLRDPRAIAAIGYDPGQPRAHRLSMLAEFGDSIQGQYLEAALESAGGDGWLPRAVSLEARTIPPLASTFTLDRKRISSKGVVVPTLNPVVGARWVSLEGDRLKIILSTGGCGTPTCQFCTLPEYGRALRRIDIASTVRDLLEKHRPRRLALYNDGNFFNEREIDEATINCICTVINSYKVDALCVESTPRFISQSRVEKLKYRSGVAELEIGLGLQAVGNGFSVGCLGRPDVDSCFDWAIDQIHNAGGTVRLYLLWGYGSTSYADWSKKTLGSLQWAERRGADRVSICVYKAPGGKGGDVASLRDLILKFPQNTIKVDIVDNINPSCTTT